MTAVKLNNEGSSAFKQGDYETAISKFTEAISSTIDPELLSLLFSNRSSAYVKVQRFQLAVSDGKECIKHRSGWTKGYLRLGKALEGSGNDKEACNIYINALKFSKDHKELLLQPLIDANNRCNHFCAEIIDCIVLGDEFCNICHKKDNLFRCSQCQCLYYCSKEHQKQDWVKHKRQCKVLGEIKSDEQELSVISVPGCLIKQFLLAKKPFQSLNGIKNWDVVWEHLECTKHINSFQKLVTEYLSWPSTLISSLCQFNLERKDKLRIHILGADDTYAPAGYFTSSLQMFPLPDAEIVLIGPELLKNVEPLKYTNIADKCISISYVADCYHGFTQQVNFVVPDLILACHPGIHDKSYNWFPTLTYIVSNAIPSVFTCWSEYEFGLDVAILNLLKANILHKGNAPFPSLLKRLSRLNNMEFSIITMNSYWISFKGRRS